MNNVIRLDVRATADAVFRPMTERDSEMTHRTDDRIGTTPRQVYQSRGRRLKLAVETVRYERNRRLAVRIRDSQTGHRLRLSP